MDTNVLASLLLPGPRTEQAEVLLLAQPQWAAPPLWRSEWRNVLTSVLHLARSLDQFNEASQRSQFGA